LEEGVTAVNKMTASLEESGRLDQEQTSPLGRKIKTVFCTSGGVLGAVLLGALVRDPDFEVVGLVKSVRVFRADMGFLRGAANFFLRCGILYTVYIWFITTAVEFVGLMLGRENASVGIIARHRRIPVFATRDLSSKEGREFLQAMRPDLLIAAHFDQKLDPDLCDRGNYAAVNVHPSLLPRHRGVEPVLQSLLADEQVIGVTLHRLAEEIDSGKILESRSFKRDPGWSVFAASFHLLKAGADLVISNKRLLLESGSGSPQPEGGTYESWPTPREVYRLYGRGKALIRFRDLLLF
jgi:folate-dependent phosphoribosylglycinamide formyltransferase PurN